MRLVQVVNSEFTVAGKRHYGFIITQNEGIPAGTDNIEVPGVCIGQFVTGMPYGTVPFAFINLLMCDEPDQNSGWFVLW